MHVSSLRLIRSVLLTQFQLLAICINRGERVPGISRPEPGSPPRRRERFPHSLANNQSIIGLVGPPVLQSLFCSLLQVYLPVDSTQHQLQRVQPLWAVQPEQTQSQPCARTTGVTASAANIKARSRKLLSNRKRAKVERIFFIGILPCADPVRPN